MHEPWIMDFLRAQFEAPEKRPEGRCVRIQLMNLSGRRVLRSWQMQETVQESDIEKLASQMLDEAQQDASALFGRHKYSLNVYFENVPAESRASRAFWRDGGGAPETAEGDDIDPDSPTLRALLGQLMKHNEANQRAVVVNSQQLLKAMATQLEIATERNAQMEAQRIASVQIYESLLSERHVREATTRESELKQKMLTEVFNKVTLLFPVIVNKLAGQRIMPEPSSMQNEMLGAFVGSLTHEQMTKLNEVLTPEQLILVLELVQARRKFEEQQRQEQELAQRSLATGSDNGVTTPPVVS